MNLEPLTSFAKKAAQKKADDTEPMPPETRPVHGGGKLEGVETGAAPGPEIASRPRWDEVSVSQITAKMRAEAHWL